MENKRKRLSKEERRQQILEHTSNLVAQKGFRAVSIRDIAKSADINESLIYRHFSSKDELLIAMYKEFLNKSPKFYQIPETESDFIQMLFKVEEAFLKQNMKNQNMLKTLLYVVLDEYPLPPEISMTNEGTFLNWLNKCIDKGKEEWGYDKNIINEVYISFFMGSMQYFVVQNSLSGVFNVKNKEFNGVFTKMLIKALKSVETHIF